MLQLMRERCSYTYPPLSAASYSFIQLSELEQCRVKTLAQGFTTTAQDSNPGSRSQESEALPRSHCALTHPQPYGFMGLYIKYHRNSHHKIYFGRVKLCDIAVSLSHEEHYSGFDCHYASNLALQNVNI